MQRKLGKNRVIAVLEADGKIAYELLKHGQARGLRMAGQM